VRDVGGFASIDSPTRRELAAAIGCSESDLMRRSRRSNTISGTSGSQVSTLLALYNPATTPLRDEIVPLRRTSRDRSPYLGPFQSDLDLPSPTMGTFPSVSPPLRNRSTTPPIQSRNPSMDDGPFRRWSPTPSMTARYETRIYDLAAQRVDSPPSSSTPNTSPTSPINAILNPLRRLTNLNLGNRSSNARPVGGGHVRSRSLSALLPKFGRSVTPTPRPSMDAIVESRSGGVAGRIEGSSGAGARDTYDGSAGGAQSFPDCVVCMAEPRAMLFPDCRHMVTCQTCCDRIVLTDARCPSCRKPIRETPKRVFG